MENILQDFAILEDLEVVRKPKIYKRRYDPFKLGEDKFFSRYRFDKVTARFLISLLQHKEPQNNRGLPSRISLQVLTTLRFFGRNAHQSDIGDLNGMFQTTVGRIIKNISRKMPHFIKFPSSDELVAAKQKFYRLARFPNVIGAIDCTHVRIKCPAKIVGQEMASHYLNRKGFYSLNGQIVCDADCKIRDIVASSRGSKHDARIWSECQLKRKLELNKRDHNGVLLGVAGYPLSTLLLTPIRNTSTAKEDRLRVDLDTAKNIVVAVAVLHNIAKERNSSFLDINTIVETDRATFSENNSSVYQTSGAISSANAYRTAFINAYF